MIRNMGISAGLNLYRAGIQFVLNLSLAYFLDPSDFGLIALLLPITLFILLIGNFGLTSAIVQRPSLSRIEAGSAAVVCISLGAAIFITVAVLYSFGLFASRTVPLQGLALAFAAVALLALASIVPRALLERRLSYGTVGAIEAAAGTIGFTSALFAAWAGAGVWSFAIYHLLMQIIRFTAYWAIEFDNVELSLEWRHAVPLMGFGSWIVAFDVVNYLMRNGDKYIIGGLLGTHALGLYALGYQVMLIPLMAITWPVSGVLLATLSRLRGDLAVQRQTVIAVLAVAAAFTLPMMTFIGIRGDLLLNVALPERWHAAGVVVGRMAIAGGLQSVMAFVGPIFVMQKRIRGQFVLQCLATVSTIGVVAIAALLFGTVNAVADAYVVLSVLLAGIYLLLLARMIRASFVSVAAALAPGLVLSAASTLSLVVAESIIPAVTLRDHALLAVSAYFGSAVLLVGFQRRRLRSALDVIQGAGLRAAAASS